MSKDMIVIPFTKPLTVVLTNPIPIEQKMADADIKRISAGTTFRTVSEAYFHRLRLRSSEDPSLHDKIAVFFRDEGGKVYEIGLRYEDELKWPAGFFHDLWAEEVAIQKVRQNNSRRTIHAL